jgi:hypothetical protein
MQVELGKRAHVCDLSKIIIVVDPVERRSFEMPWPWASTTDENRVGSG